MPGAIEATVRNLREVSPNWYFHVPKGYIYVAMAFSCAIEGLNMLMRRAHDRRMAREAAEKTK